MKDSLDVKAKRAKARWRDRVMRSNATSTEKCLAYVIADRLNCVTLDCWPGQETLKGILRKSAKTIARVAAGLQRHGFITISGRTAGQRSYRYAPIFTTGDLDENVRTIPHSCPITQDTNGGESYSGILLKKSFAHSSQTSRGEESGRPRKRYSSAERGALEPIVAKLLGADGWDVLGRLSELDDRIVDRLCRTCFEDALSQRDLSAARLAAKQLNGPPGRSTGVGGPKSLEGLRGRDRFG